MNESIIYSRKVLSTKQEFDISIQTDQVLLESPQLRIKKRVWTDQKEERCTDLLSLCRLYIEISRLAVRIVGKNLCNYKLYLQISIEESKSGDEKTKKKLCYSSKNDDYLYSIQFHQHISNYKQIQASQLESNAALALLNKNPHIWLTLHFDTTYQISVDGECRVLTSPSGLPFNSIFPIKSRLKFSIFV